MTVDELSWNYFQVALNEDENCTGWKIVQTFLLSFVLLLTAFCIVIISPTSDDFCTVLVMLTEYCMARINFCTCQIRKSVTEVS